MRTDDWEFGRDDEIPLQRDVVCDWFNEEIMLLIVMIWPLRSSAGLFVRHTECAKLVCTYSEQRTMCIVSCLVGSRNDLSAIASSNGTFEVLVRCLRHLYYEGHLHCFSMRHISDDRT